MELRNRPSLATSEVSDAPSSLSRPAIWDAFRAFSDELTLLREPKRIRECVECVLNAVLKLETAEVFFSPTECEDDEVRFAFQARMNQMNERLWIGVAAGPSQVHAVIRAMDKADWLPFTSDEIAFLEVVTTQLGLRLDNLRMEREILRHQDSAIDALAAAIEVKDRYTAGHTKRVGVYAMAIVDRLAIGATEKKKIRLAGILHDIGKIGVPDRILLKPHALTSEEWDEMRLHTEAGFDIVSRVAGLEEIAEILRHHHERWDGSGYPRGLKGTEIPFASRVIAVADTFDAIVTDRPYRPAKSPEEAKAIIESLADRYFEASVVAAFSAAFPRLRSLVSEA